jgi:UDP-N-acetylmuramoylalanine--D-glutamate ligase
MCKAAGVEVLAGANLGEPALDLLAQEKPELYVLELSSFQLQRTQTLPATVAVLLNISPDHLDWHSDEEEYRNAKYRIYAECEGAVWNRADPDAVDRIPKNVKCKSFGLDVPPEGHYGIVTDEDQKFLARGEQLLLATDDLALFGAHNQANALAALATGELIGLELSAMLQVLHEFPGLPHRMQFVATIDGVDYINDSKATNVGAATASVESVDGLVVLLAGGQGKGGDFEALAKSVHRFLRAAVLYGEDGPGIADALDGLVTVHRSDNLLAAVGVASSLAERGDTILLAPACASFDQYSNYQERGEDFCQIVQGMPA